MLAWHSPLCTFVQSSQLACCCDILTYYGAPTTLPSGRAGRRNSVYRKGLVTCLQPGDMPRLRAALDVPLSSLSTPAAGLFPEFDQMEALASQVPGEDFPTLLQRYEVLKVWPADSLHNLKRDTPTAFGPNHHEQ